MSVRKYGLPYVGTDRSFTLMSVPCFLRTQLGYSDGSLVVWLLRIILLFFYFCKNWPKYIENILQYRQMVAPGQTLLEYLLVAGVAHKDLITPHFLKKRMHFN
uniref:Uncharacterized protein n=1 Tax=Cacopsylla melanoneura TaxID=428564 RepID=A0A8D8M504_9HEMI